MFGQLSSLSEQNHPNYVEVFATGARRYESIFCGNVSNNALHGFISKELFYLKEREKQVSSSNLDWQQQGI